MENKLTQKEIKNEIANKISTELKNEVGTALANKNIGDSILAKFNELAVQGQLHFPSDYSVGNALKLAYSKIISSGLQKCDPLSIANSLSEYVIQGLDVSRNQAYFIDYGGKLVMQRSYFGDQCVIKRTGLVRDITAICVYKDDEFEVGFDEFGKETVLLHKTKFENRDKEIIGAYAWAEGINGYRMYCIMTAKEIEEAWKMSKNYSSSNKFQKSFRQEASKRTVIRRLVKTIFNTTVSTTKEQDAIISSFNRSTENEYINESNERKLKDVTEVKDVIEHESATKKVENPFENNEFVDVKENEEPISNDELPFTFDEQQEQETNDLLHLEL